MKLTITAILAAAGLMLCAEEYNLQIKETKDFQFDTGKASCMIQKNGKRCIQIFVYGKGNKEFTNLIKISQTPEGLRIDTSEYFKQAPKKIPVSLTFSFDPDKLDLAQGATEKTPHNNIFEVEANSPSSGANIKGFFIWVTPRWCSQHGKTVKLTEKEEKYSLTAALPDTVRCSSCGTGNRLSSNAFTALSCQLLIRIRGYLFDAKVQ